MTQANLPNKILVIDDDQSVAKALENDLQKYNVAVTYANGLDSAMYLYNNQRFEVVLIALDYEALPGLAIVQKWRKHEIFEKRCTGFIMMASAKRSSEQEALVRELGDLEFIQKPFKTVQLLPVLTRALAIKNKLATYNELSDGINNLYEKTGDPTKAINALQKRLPDMGIKGLKMLYELKEKAKQYPEALDLVNSLIGKTPKDISLVNAKGRLLLRMGETQKARECFEAADKLAPNNIDRINDMAEMYLKLNLPEESVSKMKELIKLNPESPDLKFDMFSQLCDYGFDKQAIEFCRETTNPMEIVRHYNNHGVMLVKEGNLDKAIEEYKKALMFYPKYKENYRIYYNIGLAHIHKNS